MLSTRKSKRRAVLVAVVVLFTACLSLGVYSAKKQQPTAQQQNRPTKEWLFSIPAVRSKVKDLEIVNVRIVRGDTDAPGVAFDILNKAGRPVMAVEISCGNSAISQDGLEDEEHPKVIIEPYGILSAEMTGELKPGAPLVVASAMFHDGKEEGDALSLEMMRKTRKTIRARIAAERGMRPAERNSNK
jgi:hypothetical protein